MAGGARGQRPAFFGALVLLLALPGRGEGPLERSYVGATIALETAVGLREGRVQKGQLSLEPKLELNFRGGWSLVGTARLRYDPFDRLAPGRPRGRQGEVSNLSQSYALGSEGEAELREVYAEVQLGHSYAILGKQHIVWGKADGLKVLDVVNPQDFREFILDDFADSRIPLWAANVEVPLGAWTLQALWLPDQSYHDLPETSALFAFTSPKTFVPTPVEDDDRPRRFFRDSDAGLRATAFLGGWDLSLNYLFHYDDVPVFRRRLSGQGPIFSPEYRRNHLVGGAFANSFGSLTVRGELGFSFGKHYSRRSLSDADGLGRSDELSYVLGFDWYGIRRTFLSLQVFQLWLPQHESDFVPDALATRATLMLRRTFLNDTLTTEVFTLIDLDEGDGFIRPKINYEVSDGVVAWVGIDVIFGPRRGIFGQLSDRDRVRLGFEWSW